MSADDGTGSGKTVEDFSPFCEGDLEPSLQKRIGQLIDSTDEYIVYLDDEMFVEWSMTSRFDIPTEFAEVANEIGHLETLAGDRLHPPQKLAFERLLAEGMARILGDRDPVKAREALDHAGKYLEARSTENARSWHVGAAAVTASVAAVLLLVDVTCFAGLTKYFGETLLSVITASLLGALGALLSILSRVQKLEVDPSAGKFIHHFEGVCRIAAGTLGALVIALGVRANLAFGFINNMHAHQLAAILAVCFISGASERIVPSFISQIERRSKAEKKKKSKKKENENDETPG
jgi:hypothetical protein